MEDLHKFIMAVEYMRKCQIDYKKKFNDKAKAELNAAEKVVDNYIREYHVAREVKTTQRSLF